MSTILFGRTQDAYDVPFNNSDPLAIAAGITDSNTVFLAILEAKNDAINNDRFLLLCSYNGNANTGRYMEFFPGIDSSLAPINLAASARGLAMVLGSTANSTGTIGIFDLNVSSVTPLYSISLTASSLATATGTPTTPLFTSGANAKLALRVTSGSINRPHLYFTLSANT